MVSLIARSPAQGLLPLEGRGICIEELPAVQMTSLSPMGDGLAAALEAAHGLTLPQPGDMSVAGTASCLWFGLSHVMLVGVAPDVSLSRHAPMTDQSDAWCRVQVAGARSAEMLSYLTPIDLRDGNFAVGSATRAEIGHMSASLARVGREEYQLMVFRSMAATLVHEVKNALRSLP